MVYFILFYWHCFGTASALLLHCSSTAVCVFRSCLLDLLLSRKDLISLETIESGSRTQVIEYWLVFNAHDHLAKGLFVEGYLVCEGVVPVELVGDDVLPGVGRLLPRELDRRGPVLHGPQVGRLAGNTLLGLHLNRVEILADYQTLSFNPGLRIFLSGKRFNHSFSSL